MAITSHLGMALLEQSQAQKEITINEALARIDALSNTGIADRDLAAPPMSPAEGDVYLVAANPTGAWTGKAGKIAYYDQVWRFIDPREGLSLWVNDENVTVVFNGAAWQLAGGGADAPKLAEGRLSLAPGTPITTADVTAATTLYFTPFRGNRIALYNGTGWETKSFSELTLPVPAVANSMHDVWATISGGGVVLETTAWSSDSARATALALQDGIYVKSGAPTRRYLGSIRTTGTAGQTEDSKTKRYVWNYYQRVWRHLSVVETANLWNYSAAAWRNVNGSAGNQCDVVIGVSEDPIRADTTSLIVFNNTVTNRSVAVGIGIDSSSANSATSNNQGRCNGSVPAYVSAMFEGYLAAGKHTISWLEQGDGTDTQSWLSQYKTGLGMSGMLVRMRG